MEAVVVVLGLFQTKAINTILQPGTAINVTLLGNYTEMEAPYHANLKAYYDDNSDPSSRRLNGYVSNFSLIAKSLSNEVLL